MTDAEQNTEDTTVVPGPFFDELLAGLDQPAEPNDNLTRAFTRARQVVRRNPE